MTLALRYAARSDVGLVRQNNQDSAYAGPNLLVVADGMGGHAGGDIASSLAIAALAPLDESEHGPQEALADLERTVEQARQDLVHASEVDPDLAGMGTTVTALLRSGNTLAMAHLGDSRAYLLRDGALNQVTVDHTFVQHLVDTGRISPDEAETHPQRNVVMRVLGDFDVDLTPDMSVREARPGDRWLLCSDGLSGFVPIEQITQVLAECESPDEAADLLVTLAMTAGSTDNITVVVADVVDPDADEASPVSTSTQVVGAAASEMAPELARPAPDAPEDGSRRRDDDEEEDDEDDDARPAPKRRPWIGVLVVLVVLGGLGYGAWWAYGWTQEQFYVGVADGQVAVYQGIPQDAGPLTLSQPVRLTGTPVDELPAYWSERLDGTIRATSEAEALERAERLIDEALPTPTPSPTPEPSVSPSPSASPASGSDPAAQDEGAEA
ncbi:protein phosphatase [Isoptericola sp. CG 20/1183]|uniref:Protein phosphatase n=1 Tax=Isoptericola halotolerans TaxID=300560 RepID=A0ABX5EGZ7_9MICO|nr:MULTISPECIES: protein phosphatase 2C domain-containing protein [Isoptericola]MCK0116048.1 protein phosphatase 2C domain-containing protein [Isoptericola sp. S6320L]PRZ08773.1 protein phosphatase [Isoptericola halotolerans]PRZ10780.1 protein phosphatase [Isoptericola sp. CG 20/1183]